jgi:hypothetical protein
MLRGSYPVLRWKDLSGNGFDLVADASGGSESSASPLSHVGLVAAPREVLQAVDVRLETELEFTKWICAVNRTADPKPNITLSVEGPVAAQICEQKELARLHHGKVEDKLAQFTRFSE